MTRQEIESEVALCLEEWGFRGDCLVVSEFAEDLITTAFEAELDGLEDADIDGIANKIAEFEGL